MKQYRVSLDSDALNPEESLLESVSPESKIERPLKSSFFVVFYFGILLILGVFAIAGFNLGIVRGGYFAVLSAKNQFISVPLPPQRGFIYSKEGDLLVSNKEVFNLWFLPSKIPAGAQLSRAGQKEEAVSKLSEALGLPHGQLSELIEKNMNQAYFLVKGDLTEEEKEKITALNLPNLLVTADNLRIYPDSLIFSHLIGYVSLVSQDDLNKDDYYIINDEIGREGLESFYESELRGRRGEILINRFKDGIHISEPKKGNSLVLNIDSELQKNIYSELDAALKGIGSRSGTAVAIDPRDGRILSLVSLPSYDNSSFAGGLSSEEYKLFFENRREPLLNRAISGRFAPGSTIKPIIALAALEEGVISPLKKINAPGLITIPNPYNSEIVYTFRDWKNHGWVNMREAIANSSDIYFYTVGGGFYDVEGLGIQKIAEYFKLFKIDSLLGIDLNGEAAGFVPSPEWKKDFRGEIWYQGDTFNVSIGQGDLIATPLWVASFISALANGHALYRPFIADKVLDEKGAVVKTFEPQIIREFNFNEENLKVVREGMKLAAEIGTAKVLSDLPFEVGAKSGTAEVIKGQSTNSWISVFAPYDNPQIALTIMMESGREGSYIPHQIAYRVLKNYFAK
ncbi:MAG: penicillin-binding protein 2 [Parcubacteria group bacterium]|nr:penicillin-binding protein 2 [Parcubacteria group bacterium]